MHRGRNAHHRGIVKLILVPTADMKADMLTKPLDDKTFHRHRAACMNHVTNGSWLPKGTAGADDAGPVDTVMTGRVKGDAGRSGVESKSRHVIRGS